jgi:hypothetical protein
MKKKLYAQIVIYNSKFLSFFITVSFRLLLFKLMVDCCNASISLIELFSFAAFPSILNGRTGPFWTGSCRGPLGVRRTGGTIPGVLLPLDSSSLTLLLQVPCPPVYGPFRVPRPPRLLVYAYPLLK